MNKLLLIDGNSLVYRAYYGTAYSSQGILKNSSGFPVNAILTFTRMLLKTIDKYSPEYIFIAFDAGKKTKRHDKMPEYKANRQKTPKELIVQMPIIKEMISLMNIQHFEMEAIEADDLIGTMSEINKNKLDIMILSSDKDMYQLIDKNVSVISPQNGYKEDKIIKYENFIKEFGYLPNQVIDIKGLIGDSSDNLKGVFGIGPKTAIKLINQFSTIENIYRNIDKISGITKEKLIKDKNSAFLCKEIATIWKNIDIPFSLNDLKQSDFQYEKLIDFFKKYELNSLVKLFLNLLNKKDEKEKLFFSKLTL